LQKAQDLVKTHITALTKTRTWKTANDGSRKEMQRDVYNGILSRELAKKTLPNGIVDRAAKFIHGASAAMTASMKSNIQPRPSAQRLTLWHDVLQSMLHTIWTEEWGASRDGATAIARPDTPEPKEAVMRMWDQLKGNDPGSNNEQSPDPPTLAEEDKEDASQLRVCTAGFSRVIRKEHVAL
ncbi:hypothetical protein BGZ70_006257, partial [Mortierella alpina]